MTDTQTKQRWNESNSPGYKTAIFASIVILILVASIYGWREARTATAAPTAPPPLPVATMLASKSELPVTLNAVGSLRAVREVTLSSEVPGRVVKILFKSGSAVRRGRLIVQLSDQPERAEWRAANASAKLASAQLARSLELVPLGAESQQMADQRRAERDKTRAEVGHIDARLVQKQIRAPFSGNLGIRQINVGQFLNPGDPIATLTDLSQLHVEFQIPQQHLSSLSVGLAVVITVDAWPGREFSGRVTAIEPRIGDDNRNITVQATFNNRHRQLRPGMYVNTKLELSQAMAIAVPVTAVQSSATGDSIIVVRKLDKNNVGIAEVVPVKADRRIGDKVVIDEGLNAGDIFVTNGQIRVRPGAPVKVKNDIAGKAK